MFALSDDHRDYACSLLNVTEALQYFHEIFLSWKHFPRYWPFISEIHRYPMGSPHKGILMCSFDDFFDVRLSKLLNKQQSWR